MKILFFMSHPGHTRNFESTLRGLAARGHSVHMSFDRLEKRNLPGLWDLANALLEEYPNLTFGSAPEIPRATGRRSRADCGHRSITCAISAPSSRMRRSFAREQPTRCQGS